MGYAVYEDRPARDLGVLRWAGYGVPAICDFPDCSVEIDRGMGYRCEQATVYSYFDENGNQVTENDDWDDEREEQVEGCQMHFCDEHLYDHEKHEGLTPKPDTAEWVHHLLTDESWERWRDDNPTEVERLKRIE